MILKLFIMLFISFTISQAAYEKIRVGTIDEHYKNRISKYEIEQLLDEIEYTFESTLGVNVFDTTYDGKPINFIYTPPSNLEKRIKRDTSRLNQKKKEIEKENKVLAKERKKLSSLTKSYEKEIKRHNKKIGAFNKYVKELNKRKKISRSEYEKIKANIKKEKAKFTKEINRLNKKKREVQTITNKFNRKVRSFNNLISNYNTLSNSIESMSRNLKRVRGRTFGIVETTYKTYNKDGKKTKEKTVKNSMNKIEIYGFEDKGQLKALLAHEIGHLIGLPHINSKGALMHPILQKSQERNLSLTKDDIRNFERNF